MLSIQLRNLQFYAYHGVHTEERKLGAEYEVNATISHAVSRIPVLHISDTIDYTLVYILIKKHMLVPTALLETVATSIAADVLATFALVEEVSISITKKHPPLIAFEGNIAVTYTANRNEVQLS